MKALSFAVLSTVLVLVVAAGQAGAAEAIGIERIRHASGDGYTRIVIDLSRRTSFSWGTVVADKARGLPERVYIDLAGVRLEQARKFDARFSDGRVRRLRTGQYRAGTVRVVIELEVEAKAEVFALATPARIVIDLSGPAKALEPSVVKEKKPPVVVKPTVAKPVPAPKRRSAPRLRLVIDPGHGGRDPGARGRGGLTEKEAVMEVAQRLAAKVRLGVPADVDLTRSKGQFASLEQRKDLANQNKADLFISIHANASDNRRLRGIETYYLKNTGDRATLRLAKLENGVDMLLGGADASTDTDLPHIISDLVQGHKERESSALARHVQNELVAHLRARYPSVDSLGVKQGPFLVLDNTHMPAILVEIGFLTHDLEGARLASAAYHEAIAEGLYRGIKSYLDDEHARLD